MSQINAQVEQLASAVVSADADDLRGLMQLHTRFKSIRESLPVDRIAASNAATTAEKLLERVVLGEQADTEAALQQLGSLVADIQRTIDSVDIQPAPADATPAPIEDDNMPRPDDLPLVIDFVAEAREHLDAAEAELLKLGEQNDPEAINAIFRSFHTIKGAAGFLNLKEIGLLAHTAENMLDLARKGKLTLGRHAVELILESTDAAKSMLAGIEKSAKDNLPLPSHAGLADLRARLDACAAGVETQAAATAAPKNIQEAAATHSTKSGEAAVKVATDRLDSLINMVGELVITQSMVSQDSRGSAGVTQRLTRNLGRLDKITRELQDLSMSMRMVPIQGVFQKMVRLVRDLSGKFGKQMELNIVGGDTELDRNVVEAIADPLMHMIRNAADHGLENSEDRAKAGKSPVGRIDLRAFHRAGQIVIEISDDGKGLNRKKIFKKAYEAGILKEGEQPSDADVFRLIFHAGLSTAEKVTDVSGRGVGMDVVKKNVEALRGRIDITSTEGKGSTFTLSLPLTLAVIDGLVARVGSERYIIPLLSIEQSIRPRGEQISTVQGRGELCMVRGRALRLFRVHKIFDIKPNTEDPTNAILVIVQDNGREACLMVDELLGQQQVVIKSLDQGVGKIHGISGGAILGDGTVSLILDVPGVVDLATAHEVEEEANVA